ARRWVGWRIVCAASWWARSEGVMAGACCCMADLVVCGGASGRSAVSVANDYTEPALAETGIGRSSGVFCARLRHRLDRVDDRLVAGAAAIVPGKMRADCLAARDGSRRRGLLRRAPH